MAIYPGQRVTTPKGVGIYCGNIRKRSVFSMKSGRYNDERQMLVRFPNTFDPTTGDNLVVAFSPEVVAPFEVAVGEVHEKPAA